MGGDTPSFQVKKIQDGADFGLYIFRGNSSSHHNFLTMMDDSQEDQYCNEALNQ